MFRFTLSMFALTLAAACSAGLAELPASEDPAKAQADGEAWVAPENPLEVSAFAGEEPLADPHAGHNMGHGGHKMDHSGHKMGAEKTADPHAGHKMGALKDEAPDPAPADPHAGHKKGGE